MPAKKLTTIANSDLCTDGKNYYRRVDLPKVKALTSKGESRCFVFKQEDVVKVEEILKNISEGEFRYMPSRKDIAALSIEDGKTITTHCGEDHHWIHKYQGDLNDLTWTGKFQPDLPKLYKACKKAKIQILIRDRSYGLDS